METDGQHTEGDGKGARSEDNVVRLPRDWLGPREELVPFGPAARARARVSEDGDSAETLPPMANDFWGEDSAALHNAMQAPPPSGLAEPRQTTARQVRRNRRAQRRLPLPSWRPAMTRPWLVVGASTAALATAITVVLIAAGGQAALSIRRDAALSTRQGSRVPEAQLITRYAPATSARPETDRRSASARRSADHRRSHRGRVPVHRRRQAMHSSGASQALIQPVQYAPATSAPVSNTAPIESTSSDSDESINASSSSASSGPVGPGAPFGPGHLG